LLAHGHDVIGNLLIGDAARQHFLSMPSRRRWSVPRLPALALAASAGELPGSSAGGEQPKFCAYTEHGHVLVKFTAAEDNAVSQRWRDLLLAEHLALAVLGVSTSLWDFGSQRFLEVPRFDRIGPLGRVAVFSCARWMPNLSAPPMRRGRWWCSGWWRQAMSRPSRMPVPPCCGRLAR
jgi:hypothetical protein